MSGLSVGSLSGRSRSSINDSNALFKEGTMEAERAHNLMEAIFFLMMMIRDSPVTTL